MSIAPTQIAGGGEHQEPTAEPSCATSQMSKACVRNPATTLLGQRGMDARIDRGMPSRNGAPLPTTTMALRNLDARQVVITKSNSAPHEHIPLSCCLKNSFYVCLEPYEEYGEDCVHLVLSLQVDCKHILCRSET